ncbi:C-methyltransferase [Amycolatopsis xylanica]|uniref:C-methyltransferase n=1 Tax=Amycolatopsis xylanica TaxID=589385 RepID=A0A1H2VR20_9PSEU|nr:class I SAM-dependent methyltransferase [Amycolatopsis xylanica]SDW70776.1 C-methyltransferase [Amycolatopsis xylanica]
MSTPAAPGVTRERLLDMMTGYKATYLLRAAVSLGVFGALADGPASAAKVAAALGTDPRATRILLGALAAEGLLGLGGEGFALAPGAAELLVPSSPGYFGGNTAVASSDWEWRLMGGLAGFVRAGGPAAGTAAEAPDFPFWVDFATHLTGLTKAGSQAVAELLTPWARERPAMDVLDVGCGHGLFGLALAATHPEGRLWCQDWPSVLDVAAGYAARRGMADRTSYLPGDAFTAELGGSYDVIVLANFLLQFSAARCAELLARLVPALKPGGRIVIAGFTTGDAPPAAERHAHLLGLLMLAGTSGGELHSGADYLAMLAAAGLAPSRPASAGPVPIVLGERA